ncbi:MAG: ferritin family protein [Oscillospiraceae bacterium]
MDGDMMRGLENFDRVWSRVTGEACRTAEPPVHDDIPTLREFINDEARDAGYYALLSRRMPGAARTLMCISRDERVHLRELQVEYFLLCGDSSPTCESCPLFCGTLKALRMAYGSECAGAAAYLKAAEETGSECLRALYREHAADETRHAEILRELISRVMA